ncbi:hypothetical protein J2T15_006109 [Paenibacillus harenae]|uniref:Uncharacterized protein n=1 Tax=Paenibacillus harenae TaxID=306543 RepID=A0ABT9UAE9_PAEHA|nr:hypothetical protein [Paenibacillus harenae]
MTSSENKAAYVNLLRRKEKNKSNRTILHKTTKEIRQVKDDPLRPTYIQIVASIEIDPNDWGGVAFYIPDKNIISRYPEIKAQSKPRTT